MTYLPGWVLREEKVKTMAIEPEFTEALWIRDCIGTGILQKYSYQ